MLRCVTGAGSLAFTRAHAHLVDDALPDAFLARLQ
jgi:hypothetical protein